MQFGQSLLLAAGFTVGKGSETVQTVRRNNLGIRPYASVLESGFFRGAAFTYSLGRLEFTPFYSRLYQDARTVSDFSRRDSLDQLLEDVQVKDFTSLPISGLHRTPTELQARRNLLEQNYGANVLYSSERRHFQVGLTVLQTDFGLDINREPNYYNQFEFRGSRNTNLGLSGHYNWHNFSFFSELARSRSGGWGMVGGLVANLSKHVEFASVGRRFDRDFHTFYGAAFGENTRNINEQGMYWGLKLKPNLKWTLAAYYDYFEFPWLKFGVKTPSQGHEYLLRLSHQPSKQHLFYFQYRLERKGNTLAIPDENTARLLDQTRRNYILNFDYPLGEAWSARSRVQWSSFDFDEFTLGMAMMQDLNYSSRYWKLGGRLLFFDTEDYDNRQYAYERDVLYAFAIPAYFGRGLRYYLVLELKPLRNLTLWAKFAETIFVDRNTVGSGLDEIAGPVRSDLRVQARYTF
ncbi:MAG: hypothetical protein HC842_03915 [Cytophagales bacterium]|nr:hypothetical protein [Cytophagales bacterium]